MKSDLSRVIDPWRYLDPFEFVTQYDRMAIHINSGLAQKQFQKGVRIGFEYDQIHIAVDSTWTASGSLKNVCTYEGIGRNACTADLLRGFLRSDAAIVVSSWDGNLTQVKPKGYWFSHESSVSPSEVRYLIGRTGESACFYSTEYRQDAISQIVALG